MGVLKVAHARVIKMAAKLQNIYELSITIYIGDL